MSELVLLHHNEPVTTSLAIAACTENEHASVLVMIQKYVDEFRSFGEVVFQIAEPGISRFQIGQRDFEIANSRDKRGRPTEFAWLNEGQSTFLMTLLRNSPVVIQFKVALVKAFYELRARRAVPPAPTFPNHSADRLVASDRSFRALMRSAKAIGYSPEEATRMARDGAARLTGMDVLGELGMAYEATLTPREALQRFMATYDPAPYWDSDKGRTDDWEAYNCAYLPWCKERRAKPAPYDGFCSASVQSANRV